jgi:hypothetical protein
LNLSILSFLGPITYFSCQARVWTVNIAADITLGALFSKVWRVWRVMEQAKNMKVLQLLTVYRCTDVIRTLV